MKSTVNIIVGAAFLLGLAVAGCTLKIPGAPTWTVEGTVPFNERTYRLSEILTDSASAAEQGWGIFADPVDSLMRFSYEDTIESQIVGDKIRYEASSASNYVNKIGTISVGQPEPDSTVLAVSDLNPDLEDYSGPLLPFEFGPFNDPLQFDVFRWVRITDGSIELGIKNDFPFAIEDLTILLTSLPDGDVVRERTVIDSVVFENRIEPGETDRERFELSGKMITSSMEMTISGFQPDTYPQIDIVGDEALTVLIQISKMEVDSASAEVAEQLFETSDSLDIENENRIQHAEIVDGSAVLDLENTTPFKLTVDVEFLDIITPDNSPLTEQFILEPVGIVRDHIIDLSDHRLNLSLNRQVLRINASALVEDTRTTLYHGTSYQTITGDQGVVISYRTTDFTLKSFEGILDSVRVDIPDLQTAVDIPKGLDNIQFTNAALTIMLDNTINAPVRLNIDVTGTNSENGKSVTLPVRVNELTLGQNTIVVQDTAGLVGVFPDTINITGWIGMGEAYFGNNSLISVNEDQGISGSFKLVSGLQMIIGSTYFRSDLVELERLDYPLEAIEMNLNLTNTIPLSGKVRILVGNDSTRMDTIVAVDLPRVDLDIVTHRALNPVEGSFLVNLGPEQIKLFNPVDENAPIYSRQHVTLYNSNGEERWLYADDSLTVQASATVFYTIDFTEEEK